MRALDLALKLGCGRSPAASHHAGLLRRFSRSCKRREASALVEGVMMADHHPDRRAIGEVSRYPATALVKLADPDPIDGLAL
jgi:hypothetical protein